MRVLHFGNVAMNGYNNAKLLRRVGIEADALCDETALLSQPEWEEADIRGEYDALEPPGDHVQMLDWERPPWVLPVYEPLARRRFRGQFRLEYAWSRVVNAGAARMLHRRLQPAFAPLRETLGSDLSVADVGEALRAVWMHGYRVGPLRPILGRYDVVQAYATHPILTLAAAPDRPYVAFEHGTMRELPFEESWRGRMLSVAYRLAAKVIITNADVDSAARRLGLENTTFIPHPLDETEYTPGPSELGARLRAEGFSLVLFAPARQDWREKGSDVMLNGYAEFLRDSRENAIMLIGDWGRDTDRSRALVASLGIEAHIRWIPVLPKRRLIDAYRAADVVLDQFVYGTFGGIPPEAMACAKPVVIAFEPRIHDWAFSVLPPLVNAATAPDVAAALARLATDPAERGRLGRAGREWVEEHHGWRLAADRQRAIYEEVLATA